MTLIDTIKFIALLAAALLVGTWFLEEVKKSRATGAPWYRPYLTVPGFIILVALILPILVAILRH